MPAGQRDQRPYFLPSKEPSRCGLPIDLIFESRLRENPLLFEEAAGTAPESYVSNIPVRAKMHTRYKKRRIFDANLHRVFLYQA